MTVSGYFTITCVGMRVNEIPLFLTLSFYPLREKKNNVYYREETKTIPWYHYSKLSR